MSLKDSWKETGKGLGRSFAGLGKSIVKSAKVGAERVLGETPRDADGNPIETDLRESWSEVGHNFGQTGKSLGQAVAGTAKTVAEAVDKDAPAQPQEPSPQEDPGPQDPQ